MPFKAHQAGRYERGPISNLNPSIAAAKGKVD